MTGWLSAALSITALVVVLAAVHVPFGDYMARVYDSKKHTWFERATYRVIGVDPDADQRWPVYLRSVLIFSVFSVVSLYALLRLQPYLPLDNGKDAMPALQSLNTAISFVTNTNWQSFSARRWDSLSKWLDSPFRTSGRPRWVWPCSLPSFGGSRAPARTESETSGWI